MSEDTAAPAGRGAWFLVSDLAKTLFGLAAFGQWVAAGLWFVLLDAGAAGPTLLVASAIFCYLVARDIET